MFLFYAYSILVEFYFYNIIFLSLGGFYMQDNIEIGERIRAIREDLKMSREKFSEMIDISDVFLGQLERGERSLSTKTLIKIVSFTGISSDFILFGTQTPNNKISKINKILNNCPENVLDYIYNLIRNTISFIKKYNI
mgnify:CR=1 FL=1